MKIGTNIALATCVGLALGWMSSCSTGPVTPLPPPVAVTAAPPAPVPAITTSTNPATTTTITEFNHGAVERRTVTRYGDEVPAAPVATTTLPGQTTTTQTTTTDQNGNLQRQTTTTVVNP